MRQVLLPLSICLLVALSSTPGFCAGDETQPGPWQKVSVNAGVFISNIDSSVRLGSGVGIEIDPEELLGLDATNRVFRLGGMWRFTKNRRHRLDLSWFAIRRSGENTIADDIILEDPDTGEEIEIPAGTKLDGKIDLDIYQFTYSYSFLQDDRVDLAASLGLYVAPIDVELDAVGLVDYSGAAKFTAPLPVAGLRMDFLLAPKWYLRSGSQIFYLEYKNFKGSIVSFQGAIEYDPWKHVGFGLGFDSFQLNLEAKNEDYPSIDFRGNLEFSYVGLQLYGRVFF